MTTPLSKTCINWCAAAALLQHVFSFLIHPQLVRLFHCCLCGSQSTARAFWIVQVCESHFTWPQTFCLKKTPAFRCSSTTAISTTGFVDGWILKKAELRGPFFNIKEMEAFHHSKWICLQLEDGFFFTIFWWFFALQPIVSSTEVLTDLCFTTAVIIPPSQYGKCVTLNRGVKITWFLGGTETRTRYAISRDH